MLDASCMEFSACTVVVLVSSSMLCHVRSDPMCQNSLSIYLKTTAAGIPSQVHGKGDAHVHSAIASHKAAASHLWYLRHHHCHVSSAHVIQQPMLKRTSSLLAGDQSASIAEGVAEDYSVHKNPPYIPVHPPQSALSNSAMGPLSDSAPERLL